MLDVRAAEQLLDFSARIEGGHVAAREQLEGAVAIHNILEREQVAYLADEVGMGKTYVALGALALFRHFNPTCRALIIAPRENIQWKWIKDYRNFINYNVRYPDLRVKSIDGRPTRRLAFCGDLVNLLRESALDPDADFFCRLTSFSIAVSGKGALQPESIRGLRDRLRAELPWLADEVFDLRSKQAFKDNFARALCCGLPTFDLVIIDEGHNLKHGFQEHSAARNRVLGLSLGRDSGQVDKRLFPRYGVRARRVLFLSATPVEETYRQLWNQLDVVGKSTGFDALRGDAATEDEKKAQAARFLIRRVTKIRVGGQDLTKNQYRRLWRRGGVSQWDEPIVVKDLRQKLILALVQKKVSELLQDERFNSSFQIGMLASFESFFETAKIKRLEDESTFDDPEQTNDTLEREGVDVHAVNRLAASHRRYFGSELPHPKMDALVESLARSWETGRKTLVFVRRVASVKELKRKLDERYDRWLLGRLRNELPAAVLDRFEGLVRTYQEERRALLDRGLDVTVEAQAEQDAGSADTFFAWFFRGEGPRGVISGANIQQRFVQRGTTFSTFFDDNYVASILGCDPEEATARMAAVLGISVEDLRAQLQQRSQRFLPKVKKIARADRFEAVQAAAAEWLKEVAGPHQDLAKVVWHARFEFSVPRVHATESQPIGDWLELRTFFTELRKRPALRDRIWADKSKGGLKEAFRESELRRQLIASAARLGHAFIDLYVMTIQRLSTLQLRAQEASDSEGANSEVDRIVEYLDLLERQMGEHQSARGWRAFDELADLSAHFGLIVDLNVQDVLTKSLSESARLFGQLLRQQQPVGGMAGQVNQTLVRQFRMPGYPLVLISTDLLQEGEDLHTFCSAVHHYGVAWTPSSLEQRIGRIDRVRSQTERRLAELSTDSIDADDKLQVFFPHLEDTVEVLQVRRVLERMEAFLRLMHEGLGQQTRELPKIDVGKELVRAAPALHRSDVPLKSAFPVALALLRGATTKPAVSDAIGRALKDRLNRLSSVDIPGCEVRWEADAADGTLLGTATLGRRIQPFVLIANQYASHLRIRCISPVGRVYPESVQDDLEEEAWRLGARLVAVLTEQERTYDLTVEEDVLLGSNVADDAARVGLLLRRVVEQADLLEQDQLPGLDQELRKFREDLVSEAVHDE